jgi:ABC-type transport system substrate-binding protein
MNKFLLGSGMLLLSLFICSACSESSAPTPTPVIMNGNTPAPVTSSTTLRVALLDDISSANVWFIFDKAGGSYWNHAVEGGSWPTLFGLSEQRFDLIPNAARDIPGGFTQENGFFTNTISLKENLKWSDGSPVTSADVVFTINTVLKFNLGMNWKNYYDPAFLDHAESIDLLTVKFYFSRLPGLAKWQYGLMQGYFVNKTFWEPKVTPLVESLGDGSDESLRLAAIQTLETLDASGEPLFGAYVLNQWQVGSSISYLPNSNNFFTGIIVEEYASGAYREFRDEGGYEWSAYGNTTGDLLLKSSLGPQFKSIDFTIYDYDQAYLAMRNSDIDTIVNPYGMTAGTASQLGSDPRITLASNPQNGMTVLAFNENRDFFAGDPGWNLRKAVACLLDLKTLSETILQQQVIQSQTLVPAANAYWTNPNVNIYCNGLDENTRFLKAAEFISSRGYSWSTQFPLFNPNAQSGLQITNGIGLTNPDGTAFPSITVLALAGNKDPLRAATAEYIVQEMKKLGFPVTIQYLGFNELISRVYINQDYDMALLGWGYPVFPEYLCSLFDNGLPTNPFGYQSVVLAARCDSFADETDLTKAQSLVFDIQNLLATDIPVITLYSSTVYDPVLNRTLPYTDSLDGINYLYNPHPIAQALTYR